MAVQPCDAPGLFVHACADEPHAEQNTYTPTPVPAGPPNPVLQREVHLREGLTDKDYVEAWALAFAAKDALNVDNKEKAREKITEALRLLEDN